VQSLQFRQGGPNADLGAVVLDITGLPDASTVKEAGRIRAPNDPGGFHNIFIYKHSNGRVLLLATGGPYAKVYDLGYVVEGRADEALVATIPVGPDCDGRCGYHDMYAGFHPDTQSDRFYGGGTGGYYVYDITDLETPKLVVSLTGITGVTYGPELQLLWPARLKQSRGLISHEPWFSAPVPWNKNLQPSFHPAEKAGFPGPAP